MSAEIEEQITVVQPEDNSSTNSSKKAIVSYTREFLLSLSELDVCKKLPEGFDESLLSEFQETSNYGSEDRPRVLGSSPLQGFRRTEYGSSPPARGDSGSSSRGPQRWDSHSSGKSEGDSDSELGRRFGSQARKTLQNAEHDGLLGSGSFPRPPGFAAGNPVPRSRPIENLQLNKSNEPYQPPRPIEILQLNKSNEPYQPPRPYKAGPHLRRETKDSFNDETFGSSDYTSEDRAEEEKNRRAEFELMRKEHHKAFQESQKLNSGKPKDSFYEMVGIPENLDDGKFSSGLDNVLKEAPHDDASKLSVFSQAPPTRPLVPPGFVSGVVDKSSACKSHLHADGLQVEKLEVEQGHQDVKSMTQERGSSDWLGGISSSSNLKIKKGLLSVLHGVDQERASPSVTEVFENGETLGFDSEIGGNNAPGEPVRSTSILDKLLGSGLTTGCESSSNIVDGDDPKTGDIWSDDKLQSKFACWFSEDDKKTLANASTEKPNNLLSVIIGGDKGGNDEVVATTPILSPKNLTNNLLSAIGEMPRRFSSSNDPLPKPSVLTCEDLEQAMLLEIGGNISTARYPAKERDTFAEKKDGLPGTIVDNSASQHLLSLLQGGLSSNNTAPALGLVERHPNEDKKRGKSGLPASRTNTSGIRELDHSDKTLTLEALFGTAFMKELHSVQRNSVPSSRSSTPDGGPFPPKIGENGDGVGNHEGSILVSNNGTTNLGKVADWLDIQGAGKNVELSKLPSEADAKFGGFDGGVGVKLPEEDSLINLIDPIPTENSAWIPNSRPFNGDLQSFSSNTSDNFMDILVALGGATNDERSMVGARDPYVMGKPEMIYQNMHPRVSSSQLHGPPMNQSRTSFHPLDSHPARFDPQMKFMSPEAGFHGAPPTHHFPPNMGHPSFPHSSPGLHEFDHPLPSSGLHQMLMTGNHPPSHPVRRFPGAAPMPPHLSPTPAGFVQEHNPTSGFPFSQRPPSFGGPGMTPHGPELGVGNNSPEAFQRLLEMELRANPKQMHPFGAEGPSQGMHGHELDMGYRYR